MLALARSRKKTIPKYRMILTDLCSASSLWFATSIYCDRVIMYLAVLFGCQYIVAHCLKISVNSHTHKVKFLDRMNSLQTTVRYLSGNRILYGCRSNSHGDFRWCPYCKDSE